MASHSITSPDRALNDPGATPESVSVTATAASSVRVDTDKLNRLVNLVGELVITQAMLAQQGSGLPVEQYPALVHGLETLSQHARELQESVMAIRAQPVKSIFARMAPLVQERSTRLGKEIRLVTSGEATEIDKTVVEQIVDPLTRIILHAVDNGVETPGGSRGNQIGMPGRLCRNRHARSTQSATQSGGYLAAILRSAIKGEVP